jgi:hypothetical protein
MSGARILFVTSNGTGLGHLTRSMAIARRLDERFESLMLTLSAAAPVVRRLGFPVEFIASHATTGAGSDWRWSRRLRARLRVAIAEARPDVLFFDGAHPYPALVEALSAGGPEMHRVWCRRPMWRPGSNPGALGRESYFGEVLEPGEFAAAEDRGATVARRAHAHLVDPIVFCDESEVLPRAEAARELGLDPGSVNVLVALGQGREVRGAVDRCLRHLAGRDGIKPAALSSVIAGLDSVPGHVVHLRATYPMSRYYAAFDVAVSAAGYNAYHELIRFGVPALYVPMPRETDDQPARARYAEDVGVGLATDDPGSEELEAKLDRLLDAAARERMRERLAALRPDNGAGEAAAWLERLTETVPPRRRAVGRLRRYAEHPIRSARRDAPLAARVPRDAAAFVKQTIERRSPRTVILALGLADGELEDRVADALRETPDPPGRVLVVTDSLEFEPLLALGVAFEHIPARGEAQAELAGGDYEDFARRRLELILAERRRPQRVLSIGLLGARLAAATATPTATLA